MKFCTGCGAALSSLRGDINSASNVQKTGPATDQSSNHEKTDGVEDKKPNLPTGTEPVSDEFESSTGGSPHQGVSDNHSDGLPTATTSNYDEGFDDDAAYESEDGKPDLSHRSEEILSATDSLEDIPAGHDRQQRREPNENDSEPIQGDSAAGDSAPISNGSFDDSVVPESMTQADNGDGSDSVEQLDSDSEQTTPSSPVRPDYIDSDRVRLSSSSEHMGPESEETPPDNIEKANTASASEPRQPAASHTDCSPKETNSGQSGHVSFHAWTRGVIVGAVAFPFAYLLSYLVFLVDILLISSPSDTSIMDLTPTAGAIIPGGDVADGIAMPVWELVLWIMYGGLFAEATVQESGTNLGTIGMMELVDMNVTVPLYTIVTVFLLFGSGIYMVRHVSTFHPTQLSPTAAAKWGLLPALGFAACTAVVAALLTFGVNETTAQVTLGSSLLFASGISIIAGGTGGVFATQYGPVHESTEPSSDGFKDATKPGTSAEESVQSVRSEPLPNNRKTEQSDTTEMSDNLSEMDVASEAHPSNSLLTNESEPVTANDSIAAPTEDNNQSTPVEFDANTQPAADTEADVNHRTKDTEKDRGAVTDHPNDVEAEALDKSDDDTDQQKSPTDIVSLLESHPEVSYATIIEESRSVYRCDVVSSSTSESNGRTRTVALSPNASEPAETTFTQRARQWASISHNRTVASVYLTAEQPVPWIEFDEGEITLEEALAGSDFELDREAKLTIMNDVVDALRLAGLYNMPHPTLSPETVHLTREDDNVRAFVADWGVSLVGADPKLSPTPYTPPEFLLDNGPRSKTKVYQFATLAYRVLTDHEPFVASGDLESAITSGELTRASECGDLPKQVDDLFARSLTVDHEHRMSSVTELWDRLHEVVD